MTPFADIEAALDGFDTAAAQPAGRLLGLAEAVLENWADARGETPTAEKREGFRLLALHRQGARGEPSFNACRETCREIAFHANLLRLQSGDHAETARRTAMMAMLVRHLLLFVSGKMQVAGLGEFCCSSRPLRSFDGDEAPVVDHRPDHGPERQKVA